MNDLRRELKTYEEQVREDIKKIFKHDRPIGGPSNREDALDSWQADERDEIVNWQALEEEYNEND